MSIHVALHHRTTYPYDRLVALGPQIIRLRPAPHGRTPILSYSLKVEPQDAFPQLAAGSAGQLPRPRWSSRRRPRSSSVTVDLVADMAVINPFDFFLEPAAETWPFAYDPRRWPRRLAPFRKRRAGRAAARRTGSPKVDRTTRPHRRLPGRTEPRACSSEIGYVVRMEPGVQTLRDRRWRAPAAPAATPPGCWSQLLRHLGFAARFVSGYLIQLTPDVKPLDGPEARPSDFTDLHAWCEVYLPGAGWIGLDPTSGLLAGEGPHPARRHARAVESAAPISGAVEKSEVEFEHRDGGDARARDAARHQALHRRAVAEASLATGDA